MTPADVRVFQRSAYDHLGAALSVDGVVGPRTAWAMAICSLPSSRVEIVARAISKLGISEDGDNRHPEIDAWLTRCGVPVGLAWCAAFASWCIGEAPGPGRPIKCAVAGAQNLGRMFPHTDEPIPGDVMWYPTNTTGSGHCGIVTGVTLSEVMCIEGNQRNAVRCVRRLRDACRFSRTVTASVTATPLPAIPPGVQFVITNGTEGTR